jgi:hypothetical protein
MLTISYHIRWDLTNMNFIIIWHDYLLNPNTLATLKVSYIPILETYVGFSRFINIWMLTPVLGIGKILGRQLD